MNHEPVAAPGMPNWGPIESDGGSRGLRFPALLDSDFPIDIRRDNGNGLLAWDRSARRVRVSRVSPTYQDRRQSTEPGWDQLPAEADAFDFRAAKTDPSSPRTSHARSDPIRKEASTMYRYLDFHGKSANRVRRCPFGHPSCDYPLRPLEEGLVTGPHHCWSHLVDVPVEVRRNDKYVRSGVVEEVTADSAIAWLAADGTSTRLLVDKNDGYEIWTYFCIDVSDD